MHLIDLSRFNSANSTVHKKKTSKNTNDIFIKTQVLFTVARKNIVLFLYRDIYMHI